MLEKKAMSNEIKIQNRQMIYQYIRSRGVVSKQDIVVDLQLSLPTITQNLEYLKKKRLIDISSEKIKNTGGRAATAYAYVPDAKAAIGVYLTAHHINVVAVDLSGNIIHRSKERVEFDIENTIYLKYLAAKVEEVKQHANITDEQLLGVSVAVPGLLSENYERVTYGMSLDFTGTTKAQICKYIPYQTKMCHDSYASGYAEVWSEDKIQNAFYLSLNNTLGGAIIVERRVYGGDANKGGEIGHMTIFAEGGKQCYCGKFGCADTICNAGLLDQYTDGNLEAFFVLVNQGDATAKQLWEDYLQNLALIINNLRMLFDNVIILGGYVGVYIEEHMEQLYQIVDKRNSFGEKAKDFLMPCHYKGDATSVGAAILFVDEFILNI
jgi:Transcriptional regulator/sugar kinase